MGVRAHWSQVRNPAGEAHPKPVTSRASSSLALRLTLMASPLQKAPLFRAAVNVRVFHALGPACTVATLTVWVPTCTGTHAPRIPAAAFNRLHWSCSRAPVLAAVVADPPPLPLASTWRTAVHAGFWSVLLRTGSACRAVVLSHGVCARCCEQSRAAAL